MPFPIVFLLAQSAQLLAEALRRGFVPHDDKHCIVAADAADHGGQIVHRVEGRARRELERARLAWVGDEDDGRARAGIGSGTRIFPGAYVGDDCVVGSNCTIYPNAVLMAGVEIGDNCTINAGAVLGTDGFGFAMMGGTMQKIPQIGTVYLASGVDFGANACVDRATLGVTSIGKDTKVDNLVQIGHNVTVGENCLLISQVGIAGSTKVGNRVTLAGQVGVAGHLDIGDDVVIGPQAGVPKDIPAGTTGSGSPFMEGRTFMRNAVLQPKLPELFRRVQELEKELARLKKLLPEE